ncbi:MAG: hypothetical protein QW735_04495 [archaeon]
MKKDSTTMEDLKNLVVLRLYDSTDPDIDTIAVVITKLNIDELQDKVEEIKRNFDEHNIIDWTFDDVLETLEKQGAIKILRSDYYEIAS